MEFAASSWRFHELSVTNWEAEWVGWWQSNRDDYQQSGYDLGCPLATVVEEWKRESFITKAIFARVWDEEDCREKSDIQSTCTISEYDWYPRKRILSFGFHSLIPSLKKS